ncbi:hypothetical protein SARC_06090 [Sphaeroforma arctica JP610]|uniref:Polysaccharide lyase 14 domain-containing protein n=1 Tax=Sphaeroforma arctica JP610 TaxID=667725 RepID=A0A0L0FY94_9EUKA|nr:hypothetical protein SARC_06090 [Sphaeroforma arctica JP610]KNC81589.1 hypothetical protein SARC_06090 [Sphaeroforma arctica JP610]|eukprot:XP_014155491.1 hypothetical protein SARC_06090 [Sphaeroforma arctica JP610]
MGISAIRNLVLLASVTYTCTARPQYRRDNNGHLQILDMDYSGYKAGDEPDASLDFAALQDGCFGAIRNGDNCVDTKPNDSRVQANPENSNDNVMEIQMRAGTYGAEQKHAGSQFYSSQLEELPGLLAATLEYEVYFPKDFEWTLGGKLPGMHGGSRKCSGGYFAQGDDCFSTRLMWRADGDAEAYMYIPMALQTEDLCSKCSGYPSGTKCKDISHCSLNRGAFSFNAGKWNKIKQQIWLNEAGSSDGWFGLYHDNNKVMVEDITYRSSDKVPLSGLYFSSFFGGDGEKYAPAHDQTLNFRGIKLTAGIV